MSEFKQGQMLEVSNDDNNWDYGVKEFIGMTSQDKFLCWSADKAYSTIWNYARPIQEEPLYYYQYEYMGNNNGICISDHFTDNTAKELGYLEDRGFYKIENSKRLWGY